MTRRGAQEAAVSQDDAPGPAPWQRRVVDRSLAKAAQKSVDRASELIFAAATLLESRNGDGFTVQDVADAAGQSLRTLYAHFGSKDDLLLAVLEEANAAYGRLLREAIEVDEDPLVRLTAAVYFASRFQERATRGISVGLSTLRTKMVTDSPEQLATALEPVTGLFLELVEEASAAGVIKTSDAAASAHLVFSLIDALGRSRTLGNEFHLTMPEVRDLVEFVLRGLHADVADDWEAPLRARWDEMPTGYSVASDLRPPD
jgi:AcrR family transcriptional regulator